MTVAATLDGRQAAARRWDVLVVGAGPAGARLAALAAADGLSVLLVERSSFPRPKVCGGCLSERTLAELDFGVRDALVRLGGRELRRLRLAGWRRAVDLALPGGMSVSRATFDTLLLRRAIEHGAHFLPRHVARPGELCADAREVELAAGAQRHRASAAVVVDAAGLGGARGRHVEEPAFARGHPRVGCSAIVDAAEGRLVAGTIYMAVGRGGYVGAVRLEDGRLNVAAAIDRGLVRDLGPAHAVGEILRQAGLDVPSGLREATWSGTPRLWQRPARRAGERYFAVGDAAGYIEPFTGEGIGWALGSAAMLAPLVARGARRWSGDLPGAWSAAYDAELERRQRACRALAWGLRRPLAARAALHLLRWRPAWGAPLVRHVHGARWAPAGRP